MLKYKYSINLICHCFPLLSACLANLKDEKNISCTRKEERQQTGERGC